LKPCTLARLYLASYIPMKLHNQNYNQNPATEVTSQTHNEHLKFGFLECEDSSAKTPVLSDTLPYGISAFPHRFHTAQSI
jgi:hypothetical protein